MMKAKDIQTTIFPHSVTFNNEVRNEKTLEKFIIHFLNTVLLMDMQLKIHT